MCGKRGVVGVAATDASLKWRGPSTRKFGFIITLTLTITDAMPATRVDATLACGWCLRRA